MTTSWTARRAALAPPLEDPGALLRVAAARKLPGPDAPARLGEIVRDLSSSYNTRGTSAPSHLAARLGFSFARDVPKSGAAVAELVLTGRLSLGEAPLRVLDLGAGLGATTWGVVRALALAGASGAVEATLAEPDAGARGLGDALFRELGDPADGVRLAARWTSHGFDAPPPGPFDLVLLGQVVSEIARSRTDRVAFLVERLRRLATTALAPGGSLVVIEPALRERTRVLHEIRDGLADLVFAPCPRRGPCPMLARETDWCHEDLAVDLPAWLVPTARAAGLRHEGLTFSYLVVRTDGARVPGTHRLVGQPRETKGKVELDLCTERGLVRVDRLHRDRSEKNAHVDELARGDLLALPDLGEARRIGKDVEVAPA